MNTARESAVRLLKLMMVASLVLPAALYGYASWVSYRDIHAAADERIERSLDVQQEQALKVFETVDRTFAEVDEVVRGMSDDDIRAAQPRLHPRLAQIADVMPQLQAIVLIGRDGRPLASSALESVKTDVNFADRDYFKAQADKDAGTYVSDVRTPNLASVGRDFFDLSRRLDSPNKIVQGRDRGGGAAEIFRGFLYADRPDAAAASMPWSATTAPSWRAIRPATTARND